MYSQTAKFYQKSGVYVVYIFLFSLIYWEKLMYSYGLSPPQAFDLFPFLGNGFGEFCICVEVAVSHGNNAFFCHMMKWSHLVQLPVPTKPFQGPCSAPLKAFDLQIRHWESLAQFRKRNWPLTFSLTSYVSHERNHTQKACFAKILRGPYWYKQSWWGEILLPPPSAF